MRIFNKIKFKHELYKNNEYVRLFHDIKTLYEELYYEDDQDDLIIVLDELQYDFVLIHYLTDRINDELGHDAVKIENYGGIISFNLNNDEKKEYGTIYKLLDVFNKKIDVQDLVNLLNNNACFIQIYDAKKSEYVYFKGLNDVEGYNTLVNKAINDENTIYYEDASYKIKRRAIFKELDYL